MFCIRFNSSFYLFRELLPPATESLGSILKFCPDQKASGTVDTFGAVTGAPGRASVRLEDGQSTPDSEVAAGCTVAFLQSCCCFSHELDITRHENPVLLQLASTYKPTNSFCEMLGQLLQIELENLALFYTASLTPS